MTTYNQAVYNGLAGPNKTSKEKVMNNIYYIEVETCEGIETQWYATMFEWVDMLREYAINDMGVYAYGIKGGERVE